MFVIALESDFVEIIINTFRKLKVNYWDPESTTFLSNNKVLKRYIKLHQRDSRLRILVRQYVNLQIKFLPHQLWKIELSSAFDNYKSMPYADELDFFIDQASSGKPIMGFQSKRTLWAYDEDALLNCWSIHHIHLSCKVEENSLFYERSDWLLMLHQAHDTLYLIDVIPHKDLGKDPRTGSMVNLSFARKNVFERLIRDFPDTMKKWCMNGVTLSRDNTSDYDIRTLRKSGIQQLIEVDGSVYMGGYGIATSSTGTRATILSDSYLRMISDWKHLINENWNQILTTLALQKDITNPAVFRLVQGRNGLIVMEMRSNTLLKDLCESRYFKQQKVVEK